MADGNAADTVHKFERAGLGVAPFLVVGNERRVYVACHGAPMQPGASCDYCGTGICDVYLILSSDGQRFKVGSDCVAKTGDAGLISSVKRQISAARRARNVGMEKTLRAELRKLLAEDHARFEALPSPKGFGTLASYGDFMVKNAGLAGLKRLAKLLAVRS